MRWELLSQSRRLASPADLHAVEREQRRALGRDGVEVREHHVAQARRGRVPEQELLALLEQRREDVRAVPVAPQPRPVRGMLLSSELCEKHLNFTCTLRKTAIMAYAHFISIALFRRGLRGFAARLVRDAGHPARGVGPPRVPAPQAIVCTAPDTRRHWVIDRCATQFPYSPYSRDLSALSLTR